MFSLNRAQAIGKRLVALDLQLIATQPYQYQLRAALREEKSRLLEELEQTKGKEKVSFSPPPAFYKPADIYKDYPEGHEDRQSFRSDQERMLRQQIKEKKQQVKQLCTEIEDLKCMVKCIQTERDQSSYEELSKHYERAMTVDNPKRRSPPLELQCSRRVTIEDKNVS